LLPFARLGEQGGDALPDHLLEDLAPDLMGVLQAVVHPLEAGRLAGRETVGQFLRHRSDEIGDGRAAIYDDVFAVPVGDLIRGHLVIYERRAAVPFTEIPDIPGFRARQPAYDLTEDHAGASCGLALGQPLARFILTAHRCCFLPAKSLPFGSLMRPP